MATLIRASPPFSHAVARNPEVEIRLIEVPLAEQLRGLRSGSFNVGFACTADVGDGIVAEPIWIDPLVVAVSARHPLLVHKQIPLENLVRYPLVMADPRVFGECSCELNRLLSTPIGKPCVVERISSMNMMLTLVSASVGMCSPRSILPIWERSISAKDARSS